MTDDPRRALLSAAVTAATGRARDLGFAVELRRVVPSPAPRPTMPPPARPPAAQAPEAEAEAIRRAWDAASPEARRLFLASLV